MVRRVFFIFAILIGHLAVCQGVRSQGSRYDNFVIKPLPTGSLTSVSGALITVCTSAGSGTPCAPKVANIYSDEALTTPIVGTGGAGTTNSDSGGNFGFYAAPGSYIVTVTGSGITSYTIKVMLPVGNATGSTGNNTHSGTETFTGGGSLGGNFTSASLNLDLSSTTMKTWSDPNGGGVGAPANRSASVIIRGLPSASADASVVANHAFYVGGQLNAGGAALSELHHTLFYPVIVRGTAASINDKITGVSIAAPIAPSGDTSTARSGITAALSIEANPPTTWCNGTSNLSANYITAIANLGATSCSSALNVSSGTSLFGGAINFAVAGTGINQGIGDLVIQNADTTAAGTITFYNGGSNRFQIRNTGASSLSNALRIGDTAAPNTALDVVGTGRFSTGATPAAAAGADLGTTALPWANLWLGTAATNNFKFQPAATAAARVITIADPLSPSTVGLPLTIASGTSTLTVNAALAAVTSQAAITTAGTGILTTDTIEWSYASAPTAGDSLCHVSAYPTAGNVNFVRTNPTAAAQSVSAIVLNWRVIR